MPGKVLTMMQVYRFLNRWYLAVIALPFVLLFALRLAGIPHEERLVVLWSYFWVLGIPASVAMFLGTRRRAKEFTPTPGEPIAFSEKRVTGFSNASKMSAFLTVKHALIVEVAADTIYIRPRSAGRGDIYHEFHRIPIRDVTQAQKMGDRLRLTWSGETSGDFTLMLSNPDAFLQSIHGTSLGTPLVY